MTRNSLYCTGKISCDMRSSFFIPMTGDKFPVTGNTFLVTGNKFILTGNKFPEINFLSQEIKHFDNDSLY